MSAVESGHIGELPLSCPTCGKLPGDPVSGGFGFSVTCGNCYDTDCVGDPPRFVSMSPSGSGLTRLAAIADWNDSVECAS